MSDNRSYSFKLGDIYHKCTSCSALVRCENSTKKMEHVVCKTCTDREIARLNKNKK
jgi:hypothetical protein